MDTAGVLELYHHLLIAGHIAVATSYSGGHILTSGENIISDTEVLLREHTSTW